MSNEIGPLRNGVNPYERRNLWLLYSLLGWDVDKVRFGGRCNGGDRDGPSGTRHMRDQVARRTWWAKWIETRAV